MMNKLTATALFDKNSCLIGNKDVIPKSEAIRYWEVGLLNLQTEQIPDIRMLMESEILQWNI